MLRAIVLMMSLPASPIPALSSITVDAATLRILQQHDARLPRAPASLTKLMTAHVAYEAIAREAHAWTDSTVIDACDVHAVAADETRMGLVPGETVTLGHLLEGLMVVSGNDAALALARHLAGSEAAYVQHMNDTAARMGLRDTHFVSVSGITTPGHVSTAHDTAMLAARLLADHPQVLAITAQRHFSHGTFCKDNQNTLLGSEGIDGLKTGYTRAAGFCLAATACRDSEEATHRLINITLGAPTREARNAWVQQCLQEGFAQLQRGVAISARG